jgi:hypothetical protein
VYYNICYTSPFLNKSGTPLVCFHPTSILDFDRGIVVGNMINGHLLKKKLKKLLLYKQVIEKPKVCNNQLNLGFA